VFSIRNNITLFSVFAVINASLVYFSFTQQSDSFHSEGAALENTQVIFLIISAVGFLFLLPFKHPYKTIHLAIALLCFSFILRELDLEHMDVFQIIKILGSGQGRILLLASLWASLSFYSYNAVENKVCALKGFCFSPLFSVLLFAFLMLMAGAVLDKKIIEISQPMFFEELAEVNAYMLISLPVIYQAGDWIYRKTSMLFSKLITVIKHSPSLEQK
jgi:hypothetical protein|tara:strand:- start:1078 stop:1728 length:651 start_codon:yes stop_codon:yes gene_type:complete